MSAESPRRRWPKFPPKPRSPVRMAGILACAVLLSSCKTFSPDGGLDLVAAVADILALATLPLRSDIAADRFWQAQLRAAQETVRVAGETRRAYYRAVAARQLEQLLTQTQSAADAIAEVSTRLGETGALNK